MALTDENFGISSLYRDKNPEQSVWFKIFFLNHFYWVTGCVTGSLLATKIVQNIVGADFVLIALFVAIFSSSMRKRWDVHVNK